MKFKLLLCSLALASLAATAGAQTTISGNTSGSFVFAQPGTPGLTFSGSSFSQVTAGGGASFSNLGTFNLTPTNYTYDGSTFTLQVMFTAPPGAGGGTFSSTLTGVVTSAGAGFVDIDFSNNLNNPQTFNFSNGSFQFFVNDISVETNVPAVLTGGARNLRVPEGGSTVALLGLALIGTAALRRKLRA